NPNNNHTDVTFETVPEGATQYVKSIPQQGVFVLNLVQKVIVDDDYEEEEESK
ncbi:unnamed protein product, partial [Trichobilharzia szidati]